MEWVYRANITEGVGVEFFGAAFSSLHGAAGIAHQAAFSIDHTYIGVVAPRCTQTFALLKYCFLEARDT
jgi:hypothetical protein